MIKNDEFIIIIFTFCNHLRLFNNTKHQGMSQDQTSQKPTSNMAFVYALIGNILLAAMQTLIKQASTVLSPFQILYFRSVLLIIVSWQSVKYAGLSHYIPKPRCTN